MMRAVGTHYWPTRIYGPIGHAIGGTAQQALWSLTTVAIAAGPPLHRMDLAAAAGIGATRNRLLRA